ncbi:MAG TPA: serine/threonine-protein kinase [Kofleriaceae bacterium]
MLTVGSVIGGRLRIERMLGAGGMGVVAAATHLELQQQVAVKVLHDRWADNPVIVERFIREARAVAKLRTEHVCRVLDVARLETGAPYIVMELLAGVDLQVTVATKPLPAMIAVEYVLQACAALAEAHASGIIHRDLKPANLFVTRRPDGGPLVKVLDFGIAKALNEADARLTHSAAMMGSPGYMAPEQILSARDVDVRADIWALGGVTLYQLLSARLPWLSRQAAELAIEVGTSPPQPLDIDPALRAIVWRCLEKDPAARFADVAALAVALAPFGGRDGRRFAAQTAALLAPPGSPAALLAPPGSPAALAAAPLGAAPGTLATAATGAAGTQATGASPGTRAAPPPTSPPPLAARPPFAAPPPLGSPPFAAPAPLGSPPFAAPSPTAGSPSPSPPPLASVQPPPATRSSAARVATFTVLGVLLAGAGAGGMYLATRHDGSGSSGAGSSGAGSSAAGSSGAGSSGAGSAGAGSAVAGSSMPAAGSDSPAVAAGSSASGPDPRGPVAAGASAAPAVAAGSAAPAVAAGSAAAAVAAGSSTSTTPGSNASVAVAAAAAADPHTGEAHGRSVDAHAVDAHAGSASHPHGRPAKLPSVDDAYPRTAHAAAPPVRSAGSAAPTAGSDAAVPAIPRSALAADFHALEKQQATVWAAQRDAMIAQLAREPTNKTLLQVLVLYSCSFHDDATARRFYPRLDPATRQSVRPSCANAGIALPQ